MRDIQSNFNDDYSYAGVRAGDGILFSPNSVITPFLETNLRTGFGNEYTALIPVAGFLINFDIY